MARRAVLPPDDAIRVRRAFEHTDRWVGSDALAFGLTAKDLACFALARIHCDLVPYGKLHVRDAEAARHAAVGLGLLVQGPRLVEVGLAPILAAPALLVLRETEARFRVWLQEAVTCIREMRAGLNPRERGLTAAMRWAYDVNQTPAERERARRRWHMDQRSIARLVAQGGRDCSPEEVEGMLLATESAGWEGLIELRDEGPHFDVYAAKDRIEKDAARKGERAAGRASEAVPPVLESDEQRARREKRERVARHRTQRRQRAWHVRGLAPVANRDDAVEADTADAIETRELAGEMVAHRRRLDGEAHRRGPAHEASVECYVDGVPIRKAAAEHRVTKAQVEYAGKRWLKPELERIRRRLAP